ncbi:MAG: threonine synthase, partial [Parvularculaceae bacterium]|nr:threonine synthase [Parvularculaceae bacterium]
SGDTGGAAVSAFAGAPRIRLVVLFPEGRISDVQRRFMTTSGADNVEVFAVDGAFDDCQSIVKALFADREFAQATKLSGVNSINWARLAVQTAYYFSAASQLRALGETRPPIFSVPTGNFGDAFAGHVAKLMGLAAGPILVAVNENDILARVVESGVYAPRGAVATDTPSMDIEVASNFERMLFEAADRNGARVAALMQDLRSTGRFTLPADMLEFLRRHLSVRRVHGAARAETMRRHAAAGYALDPHSAVALRAAEEALGAAPASAPVVALATAHPAKFPDAVAAATGVRPRLSAEAEARISRGERVRRIAADADRVKAAILAR